MPSDDDFYVGYDDQPPAAVVRFTRGVVAAVLVLTAVGAVSLARAYSTLPSSRFEFGVVRTFEGHLLTRPYPRLVQASASGVSQSTHSTVLLVGQGKHGADDLVEGLDGRPVRLLGTLAERGTSRLAQVEPGSVEPLPLDAAPGALARRPAVPAPDGASPSTGGRRTLRGEIVDSKCYVGVMNPGQGAVHRDCAVRCLSGGIPPALATRGDDGRETLVMLSTASGEAFDPAFIAPLAGLRVEVSGELLVEDGVGWMRVAPSDVVRLTR